MLNPPFYFYQRFSGHTDIAKLNHPDKFRLFDSFFQPDLTYIRADVDPRLFYLLFHCTPSEKGLRRVLFSFMVSIFPKTVGPEPVQTEDNFFHV